jgi:hypothetical protein
VDDFSDKRFRAILNPTFDPIYYGSYEGIVSSVGDHVSSDNRLIQECSFHYRQDVSSHRSLWGIHKSPKVLKVDKPVFALVAQGGYNIGHFLLEVLPKLSLLEELYPRKQAVIYMPTALPFHRAIASFLFPGQTVISASDYPYIQAPKIFGAGVPKPEGQIRPWAAKSVGALFKDYKAAPSSAPRVLISRQSASRRRVKNWEAVREWGERHGFTEVCLEKLSFAEQFALFRDAEFIVTPHGAGLTNLVFCQKRSPVIEFLAEDAEANPQIWYWALANDMNLPYGCLECPLERSGRDSGSYDTTVDVEKLDALFKKMDTKNLPVSGKV